MVGGVDTRLRTYYGVVEFTDDPCCLFRLAQDRARRDVILPDGLHIERGEIIGTLHLWNEHLPLYPESGPDLKWACEMRRRLRHSLALLAEHLERDPAWRQVLAIRADTNWASRLGSDQIRRVANHLGFQLAEHLGLRPIQVIDASIQGWALTRAFNPSALPRQPLLRCRHELWMTQPTLLRRYGRRRQNPSGG